MTTCVSTWFGRGERPPASHVSATRRGSQVGLTPEVGGFARLNHRLTSVVTALLPLASAIPILSAGPEHRLRTPPGIQALPILARGPAQVEK